MSMRKKLSLESCYMQLWKGKNLATNMDNSEIMYDKVIGSCDEETKALPTTFN